MRRWCWDGGPEERVVVGEEGEENSEEEGCGYLGAGRGGLVRGFEREVVGKGGFVTAEDHESRKGLGAVSYRHAGETGFCRPFETKKRICGRRLSLS